MKICMITSAGFPPREGIGHYVANLSRQLSIMGQDVEILTRGWLPTVEDSEAHSIRIRRAPYLPIPPLHVDSLAIGLRLRIGDSRRRPDLLHFHSPLVPYVDAQCKSLATAHTAMSYAVDKMEHDSLLYPASRISLSMTSVRIERRLLKSVDHVATLSAEGSHQIENPPYSIDPDKIVSIGNGVDENYYTPGGLGRSEMTVFWAGRLTAGKGVHDLLDVIAGISKTKPGLVFRIAGEGPLKKRIMKLAEKEGISRSVKLLGWIPPSEMLKEYQTASLFLMTSHYEGIPTVLLEAMSCGVACISTSVGGVPEIIEDGCNGYLVPPESPAIIAERISQLLDDENATRRVGSSARKTIVNRHSWKTIAQKYEALMKMIVEG